jgi:hypothetical protein
MQGSPIDGVEDQPRGDDPGTTFLDDPQRGPAAKSYGSFDSVASSSSTVSSKSDDSFATALKEAEDAHLITEEAVKYLKSVLGIEKNPTDGTSLKTPYGVAQGEMTMVTHGQPWITVTRYRTMRVKAEQRPPQVGEGRACQNWRAEPGLYGARLQESYPSIATNTTKRAHVSLLADPPGSQVSGALLTLWEYY